jgi:hypothetical protein
MAVPRGETTLMKAGKNWSALRVAWVTDVVLRSTAVRAGAPYPVSGPLSGDAKPSRELVEVR